MSNGFAPRNDREAAARALNLSPLPFAFSQLFGDFLTLDGRRSPGMSGITPISIVEIAALGSALYGGYESHEIETLIHLDNLRVRCSNDEQFTDKFFADLTSEH